MSRTLILLLSLVSLLLLAVTPAHAITWGEVDGDRHPNVGAVVINHDVFGEQIMWCSGTLIAPTVFLTAAHCLVQINADPDATFLGVTFDSQFEADGTVPDKIFTGTMVVHPGFNPNAFPHDNDFGVILLNENVAGITPAQLPPAGFLDSVGMARGLNTVTFTIVGYGTAVLSQGGRHLAPFGTRQAATVRLTAINSAQTGNTLFQTTNAPGTGGGICDGDSGGPAFLGTTNIVVGINRSVLKMCRGQQWESRTDSAAARAFLGQFVMLP
jgi:secreted trypsin-like serine protease